MADAIDPKCLESALALLSRRDRFEAELHELLARRGFLPEQVRPVIDHLVRRRLIDDRRTIENLVAGNSGRRAAGRERLRYELTRRGAPENLIDDCLADFDVEAEKAKMIDLLRAKFRPEEDRARGARFLLGRGFAEDEIESALDDFFAT